VFSEDNYFQNAVNHWGTNIVSLMVLGIPSERPQSVAALAEVKSKEDWPKLGGGSGSRI